MRLVLLLLLLQGSVISLHAQEPDPLFSHYYSRSMEKLRQLYQSRGLSDGGCLDLEMMNGGKPVDYRETIQSTLQKVYGRLATKIGVLFYGVSDDTMSIWLLKDTTLTVFHQRIKTDELVRLERELRSALRVDVLTTGRAPTLRGAVVGNKNSGNKLDPKTTIQRVSAILIPPVISRQLKGIEHLMIAPEFNIGQFPFYLLQPWGNSSALIDSFSISFNPHLCNLLTLDEEENEQDYARRGNVQEGHSKGRRRSFTSVNPLVVGNPAFSTKTPYILPSLPGAEAEARKAAAALKTSAITGKDAAISDIKRKAEYSDLLYFATHGVADPKNPLDGSFLAFSPDGTDENGVWTARDIQETHMKASLAILSACQTGVGQIHAGGFIGLGRAFYIARVRNTVMSLWSVDDQSTAKLMQYFLEELKKESVFFPANHLRNAIIRFRKEDSNPAHWAPFVVFGFPE